MIVYGKYVKLNLERLGMCADTNECQKGLNGVNRKVGSFLLGDVWQEIHLENSM